MIFILPVVFLLILFLDHRGREGYEKKIYFALAALALVLSLFASSAADGDHIGASLSGMISVFMR